MMIMEFQFIHKLEELYTDEINETTIGAEVEIPIFNLKTKRLEESGEFLEGLIHTLDDKRISRDYYPHQLELISSPFNNTDNLLNEILELYGYVAKFALERNRILVPLSFLSRNDVPCGMHVHVRYKDKYIMENRKILHNILFANYPLMLALADLTKEIVKSRRILYSRHLGVPTPNTEDIFRVAKNTGRWYDICLNAISGKPITLEIRLFDTPSYKSIMKFILDIVKASFEHLNLKVASKMKFDEQYIKHILMTRNNIASESYFGFNIFYLSDNLSFVRDFADRFKIDLPSKIIERESIKANYNINRIFLDMIEDKDSFFSIYKNIVRL